MLLGLAPLALTAVLGSGTAQLPSFHEVPLDSHRIAVLLSTCKPSATCREVIGRHLPAPVHFSRLAGTFPKCPARLPKGVACDRFISVHHDWVAAGVRIHPKGELPEDP